MKRVLSFVGNGKVSVPVSQILASEKVKRQVEAVKQIEHNMRDKQ
jgi:hypothetical protein